MNEQIKALMKQATRELNPDDRVWVFSKVDQGKFAELIVRECLAICEELGADYDCHFAADEIAKRFLRS